ncbi:hypothetical protein ACFLZO_00780 [Patescibacteria group bacterium]
MGTKKSFVKGLAAGAVLTAAAHLYMEMKDSKSGKSKDLKKLKKAAEDISVRVAKRAKKMGKLTKAAYGKIVDTTVAEYRGMKMLSEDELKELKSDLKDGWEDMHSMMMPHCVCKSCKAKKRKGKK